MAELVLRVGSRSAQGVRPNNEDRFVVDLEQNLFLVADGMGGQERGELASGMAAEIIPQVVHDRLAAQEPADHAVQRGPRTRRTRPSSTPASHSPKAGAWARRPCCALHCDDQVFVAGLGDSRAYLIRDDKVEQLTVDHSVAQALVASGALTPEEARHSPYQHVLHKFLGCANMAESAEVRPFTPQAGDRLLLGSDGLTNHINEQDLMRRPASIRRPAGVGRSPRQDRPGTWLAR